MFINIYGILARHIMKQLLTPFLCCFFGFMFLFFIIDLQDQISDMFKQEGNSLVDIGLFFLFILPEKIPLVVPMSLLLGTMYCFSNLNRHNEINAIRSSGISIFKMSIPVFIFSLLISIALFLSNEYLLNYFSEKSASLHQALTNKKKAVNDISFTVKDDKGERIWNLHINNDKTYSRINLQQHDKSGNLLWALHAVKGEFSKEKGWVFYNAEEITYSTESYLASAPKFTKEIKGLKINDDPIAMNSFKNFGNLTLAEIHKRKSSNIKFSQTDLQIMDVKYYALIVTPFACLLSVLLGIPLSITQQRQGAMAASAKALGIMFSYYILLHLFMNFGNSGHIPAIIAGAGPTLAFLSFGLFVCLKK